jgi:hypothetical protein
MKAKTIDVLESTGRVLCGKKLLAKGPRDERRRCSYARGRAMNEVWVTELDEGEVGEDDAVMQVASEIGGGALEIRLASGGRANLFTTEPCCLLSRPASSKASCFRELKITVTRFRLGTLGVLAAVLHMQGDGGSSARRQVIEQLVIWMLDVVPLHKLR